MGQRTLESRKNASERDVRALARQLADANPDIRATAEQLLEQSDAHFRRLVILQVMSDIKVTKRWMLGIAWSAFLPHVLAAMMGRWWWPSIGLASVGILARFALMFGPLQRRIEALMSALAPVRGPVALVGMYLDVIRYSDRYTVEMQEALERSVAQVRSGDTEVVTRDQRRWLSQRVAYEWDNAYFLPPFVWEMDTGTCTALTMVRLLAAVGGVQEREQLERLARKQPGSEKQRRLHAAINEVLPGWSARLVEEQKSETLLRAAAAPTDSSSLLRIAAATAPSDPQQMVRASEAPGENR